MPSLVIAKLLARTEAARTYVDGLVSQAAYRVGAFDANGMGQVALTDVTSYADFRFVQGLNFFRQLLDFAFRYGHFNTSQNPA